MPVSTWQEQFYKHRESRNTTVFIATHLLQTFRNITTKDLLESLLQLNSWINSSLSRLGPRHLVLSLQHVRVCHSYGQSLWQNAIVCTDSTTDCNSLRCVIAQLQSYPRSLPCVSSNVWGFLCVCMGMSIKHLDAIAINMGHCYMCIEESSFDEYNQTKGQFLHQVVRPVEQLSNTVSMTSSRQLRKTALDWQSFTTFISDACNILVFFTMARCLTCRHSSFLYMTPSRCLSVKSPGGYFLKSAMQGHMLPACWSCQARGEEKVCRKAHCQLPTVSTQSGPHGKTVQACICLKSMWRPKASPNTE